MKRLSAPVDIQIELTETCNQKCRHCYNYWRYLNRPGNKELSFDGFSAILEQAQKSSVHLITFTGGEPLLKKSILIPLVKKAKDLGFEVGLNSNATLLDLQCATALKVAGLDHALISLLGLEDVHNHISGLENGYFYTIAGIKNLLSLDIPVSVNMVVSKENLNEVFFVASLLKGIGVKSFCGTPVVPSNKENIPMMLSPEECKIMLKTLSRIGRELGMKVDVLEPIARCLFCEKEEDEFTQFFYRRNCAAAIMSCAISSTGNMRPCIHSDVEFGNVLIDGLIAVWKKMDSWTSHKILPKECQSCPAVVVCEGGCRMAAKLVNGSYDARDMYMTGPIRNLDRIAKLPKNEDRRIISISRRIHCNNTCKLRKEEFGYIVMSGYGVFFISESACEFVEYLKNLGSFTIKDLLTEGYREEDVAPIISNLLKSNIIEYESEVRGYEFGEDSPD